MVEVHRLEADVFADEVLELAGGNLAEALEARDLVAGAEFLHGRLLLALVVAVGGLLLVADAEERRLEDEEVAVADEVGEELEEKRDEEEADVHAVHVGVGGDDDPVVAQAVEALLDVQGGLEEVELFVLVDDFFREAVGVERLALQREHGLRLDVARGGEGAGGGIALDDEERALLGALVAIAEVKAAVAELAVVERGLLRALASEAADARQLLALALVLLDLVLDDLGGLAVLVQPGVERLLHELADEFLDGRAGRAHVVRAELGLGLRLEDRLLHADGDSSVDGLADVGRVVVLLEVIADSLDQCFAERREVRAAHGGVLAVDERPVFLAVVGAVGERHLDVLALEVDDGVERLARELLGEEVLEAVLRAKGLAVECEGEAAVEEGVVPQHILDELGAVAEVAAEKLFVGRKLDERAVALGGLGDAVVLLQLAPLEVDGLGLALAEGLRAVDGGEGVDGLLADAVEADGFLESLRVVFRAGVDDGDAVEDLAQRDAAAVVADAQGALGQLDLDLAAAAHGELVDGVVDRLLEEDVDAVLGVGAVAEPADIHARAEADVLGRAEGLDAGFGVVGRHVSGFGLGQASGCAPGGQAKIAGRVFARGVPVRLPR